MEATTKAVRVSGAEATKSAVVATRANAAVISWAATCKSSVHERQCPTSELFQLPATVRSKSRGSIRKADTPSSIIERGHDRLRKTIQQLFTTAISMFRPQSGTGREWRERGALARRAAGARLYRGKSGIRAHQYSAHAMFMGQFTDCPIVSHPANPVAQPLPADGAAADAIGRLPIAASLPPGVPVSMYFRDLDERHFEQNVREKAEWKDICNDPAFAEISSNCDALSVSELIQRRQDEALVVDGFDAEAEASDYDVDVRDRYTDDERQTRQRSYSNESITPFDSKPSISRERSGTANSGRQTQSTSSTDNERSHHAAGETQDQRLSREQEERLAALGVSGVPKPVQPSRRRTVAVPQPTKAFLASPVESIDYQSRSGSRDRR